MYCVMYYLGKWNPDEVPMMDFLKTFLLDLEVITLVRCLVYLILIFFSSFHSLCRASFAKSFCLNSE